jgi:hypothetical protein
MTGYPETIPFAKSATTSAETSKRHLQLAGASGNQSDGLSTHKDHGVIAVDVRKELGEPGHDAPAHHYQLALPQIAEHFHVRSTADSVGIIAPNWNADSYLLRLSLIYRLPYYVSPSVASI